MLASQKPDEDRAYLEHYLRQTSPDYACKPDQNHQRKDDQINYLFKTVHLTSGKWLTTKEVKNPIWHHKFRMGVPLAPRSSVVFLTITNGSRQDPIESKLSNTSLTILKNLKIPVVELPNVPNQPIFFKEDNQNRIEDEIIAFQWSKFLNSPKSQIAMLPRLPMIRAAVKAMDCVEQILGKKLKFVVSGESKRGWTTWLLPAYDNRVMGITPMVAEILNFDKNLNHHYQFYDNQFSFVMKDYIIAKIPKFVLNKKKDKKYLRLLKLLDPINYEKVKQIPKYVITAGNDEFFVPDSWKFFMDRFSKNSWGRVVPNVGHELRRPEFGKEKDIAKSMVTFIENLMKNSTNNLPIANFEYPNSNTIRIISKTKPKKVTLWKAHNKSSRDFRNVNLTPKGLIKGPSYQEKVLSWNSEKFSYKEAKPASGFNAFFIELTYEISGKEFKISSRVQIVGG